MKRLTMLVAGIALLAAGCAGTSVGDGSKTTIRYLLVPDPNGLEEFTEEQIARFEEQHPDIDVDVQFVPMAEYRNAVELLFKQDQAPDVFRVGATPFTNLGPKRGWTEPLDSYVTDEVTARFPDGTFDPATSSLDHLGKIHGVPLLHPAWQIGLLYYNPDILAEHGFDAPPKTWSEFEEIAAAITEEGGGETFGYSLTGTNIANAIEPLQATVGPQSIPQLGVDLRTGRAGYADDSMVQAVDLHRRLADAGVLTPGWEAAKQGETLISHFAGKKLAMYIAPPWNGPEITELNPDVALKVAPLPVPDSGRTSYEMRRTPEMWWAMSSTSEHPDEAWQLMDFLSTAEYQNAYYERFGAITIAGDAELSGFADSVMSIYDKNTKPYPDPEDAGAAAEELLAAMQGEFGVKDKWRDVAFAAITEGGDYRSGAQDLDDQLNQFIDQQISTLAGEGTDVTRDVLTYPEWVLLDGYQAR